MDLVIRMSGGVLLALLVFYTIFLWRSKVPALRAEIAYLELFENKELYARYYGARMGLRKAKITTIITVLACMMALVFALS